jgi:hypothetical protein
MEGGSIKVPHPGAEDIAQIRKESTSFRANGAMLDDMAGKKSFSKWQREHAKSCPVTKKELVAMKINNHGSSGVKAAADLVIANLPKLVAYYGHYKFRQYRFQRAEALMKLANAILRKMVDDSIRRFRKGEESDEKDRLFNPGRKNPVKESIKERRERKIEQEAWKLMVLIVGIGNWNGYAKNGWKVSEFFFFFLFFFFFFVEQLAASKVGANVG